MLRLLGAEPGLTRTLNLPMRRKLGLMSIWSIVTVISTRKTLLQTPINHNPCQCLISAILLRAYAQTAYLTRVPLLRFKNQRRAFSPFCKYSMRRLSDPKLWVWQPVRWIPVENLRHNGWRRAVQTVSSEKRFFEKDLRSGSLFQVCRSLFPKTAFAAPGSFV